MINRCKRYSKITRPFECPNSLGTPSPYSRWWGAWSRSAAACRWPRGPPWARPPQCPAASRCGLASAASPSPSAASPPPRGGPCRSARCGACSSSAPLSVACPCKGRLEYQESRNKNHFESLRYKLITKNKKDFYYVHQLLRQLPAMQVEVRIIWISGQEP